MKDIREWVTLEDVMDAHELMDIHNLQTKRSHEEAERQAKSKRRR